MELHTHNGKPLCIGPIAMRARQGETDVLLSIPIGTQVEWRNCDEGENILMIISNNLITTLEEALIAKGSYAPRDEAMLDSPVFVEPMEDDNIVVLRATCASADEARMLAELAKADSEIKKYCQLIEPSIAR